MLFLPLAIPALIMMVLTGRSHHRRMQRQPLSFEWISSYHAKHGCGLVEGKAGTKGEAKAGVAGKAGPPGKEAVDEEKGVVVTAAPPSNIECPAAPDVPARTPASVAANITTVTVDASSAAAPAAGLAANPAAAAAQRPATDAATPAPRRSLTLTVAPAEGTAAGAGDDGDDGVLVSEADVLLHDGIVAAPADMHAVQEWLVEKVGAGSGVAGVWCCECGAGVGLLGFVSVRHASIGWEGRRAGWRRGEWKRGAQHQRCAPGVRIKGSVTAVHASPLPTEPYLPPPTCPCKHRPLDRSSTACRGPRWMWTCGTGTHTPPLLCATRAGSRRVGTPCSTWRTTLRGSSCPDLFQVSVV